MSETVRTIYIAKPHNNFPKNILCNQRYRWYTFPIVVFLAQFQHFFNIYFFLICVTQLFERYSVSPLISNVMPWVIVLTFTYVKEGVDDFKRYTRDKEANSQVYRVLRKIDGSNTAAKNINIDLIEGNSPNPILKTENFLGNNSKNSLITYKNNDEIDTKIEMINGNEQIDNNRFPKDANIQDNIKSSQESKEVNERSKNYNAKNIKNNKKNEIKIQMKKFVTINIPSSDLQVGDIVILEKNKRVPADCVLLKSSDSEVYIRTDQLDGETDWKLRVPAFQHILDYEEIFDEDYILTADKPHKDIYNFIGKITSDSYTSSLSVDNMLWMNTVLASSHAMCCVVYTGKETRAVMNTTQPKSKFGLIDEELNYYSKFLCAISLFFAVLFTLMRGVIQRWDSTLIRFLVILSSVIPISLKVSIDWARYVYTIYIQQDIRCVVRNSNIPEELGRLSYLLSDKTGTLTRNEMEMKKVHMGNFCFFAEGEHEVTKLLHTKLCKDGCRNDLLHEHGLIDNQCILKNIGNEKNSNNTIENTIQNFGDDKNSPKIKGGDINNNNQEEIRVKDHKNFARNELLKDANEDKLLSIKSQNESVKNFDKEDIIQETVYSKITNQNKDTFIEHKDLSDAKIEEKDLQVKNKDNLYNKSIIYNDENSNLKKSIMDTTTDSGTEKLQQKFENLKKNNNSKQMQDPNTNLEKETNDNVNKYSKQIQNLVTNSLQVSDDKTFQTTNTLTLSHDSATDLQKPGFKRRKKDLPNRVYDLVIGLSVCHNVTPVNEEGVTTYQASSPDEVAIVQWAQKVGVKLIYRDSHKIKLRDFADERVFEILQVFPFTSESKRMGIIIRDESGEIIFFEKGADVVMKSIVKRNDWLEEETDNMAREGLRTLVIGRKILSKDEHEKFSIEYNKANSSMEDRNSKISEVVKNLEDNLELLGLTGVEDRLQEDVPLCLENLRTAGIKIWMLTGDKVETATCIAISSKLFGRTGGYKIIEKLKSREEAYGLLNELKIAAHKNESSNTKRANNGNVSDEDINIKYKDFSYKRNKKETNKEKKTYKKEIYQDESGLNSNVMMNETKLRGINKNIYGYNSVNNEGSNESNIYKGIKKQGKNSWDNENNRYSSNLDAHKLNNNTGNVIKEGVKNKADEKNNNSKLNEYEKKNLEEKINKKNKKIKKNKKEFARKRKENQINYKEISQDLNEPNKFRNNDIKYLIIDGQSISIFMENYKDEFILALSCLDAIVCCRCSPTQKADIANALRITTKKRVACIGDGGNDVSMITAADVGIGIVGKEGKQASLAADFSLERFKDVVDLFLWHGRNCYKGTARLSHLIIHRGTIISVMQAIFCSLFSFSPFTLYQGAIIVGYVTLYTFLPVFASIMGRDATKEMVFRYPELYKEMNAKKALSPTSFATWNVISFYQGAIIMLLSFVFFQNELYSIISITFSSLIVNELLMVFLSFHKPTGYMILSLFLSLLFYCLSFIFLRNELVFPFPVLEFIWKICLINAIAISFSVIQKIWTRVIRPSSVMKLSED
ncbi:putative aminophospholipid-translocase [Conglomerata obtusa]